MRFTDLFRRRSTSTPTDDAWWQSAEAAAAAPDSNAIEHLRASMADATAAPDLAEAQAEMLEGIEALLRLVAMPALPVVDTQHRVIGTDVCHYLTPASLADAVDGGGKVFVTSSRLIYAAGTVHSWAWHLVARVERVQRDLVIELKGREPVRLRCNTFEDALLIRALSASLLGRPAANRP